MSDDGGQKSLGVYAIQVRNPSPLPRPNEVVRYTLTLPDGELMDETEFIVNDTSLGAEVLSGSLASTVVRYPSNFVYKMDIVFQDDFLPLQNKSYEIRTGETTTLTGDLGFTIVAPAWITVQDDQRTYKIQGSHSMSFYSSGVYVEYYNGTNKSKATILTRVGGNQLSLDQTAFQMAWGSPTSLTIDNNSVMVSIHIMYNNPIMLNWGPVLDFRYVDFISADVTINIYNDRPMIESFAKKKFHEKLYNHNGVVMEFTTLYSGDGEYITIIGNSNYTVKKQQTKLWTWERPSSTHPYYSYYLGIAGIDVGNYSVPAFADLDGTGTRDMVLGAENGTLLSYLDTGIPGNPIWTLNTSIFAGIDVGDRSAPAFGDLDSDGDNDTVVGNETGELWYFNNTGNATNPIWTFMPTMFAGIDVGDYGTPDLADVDGDGDL
ncbi:MAG: VCBS repeat-containing protein, partial [Thermoplasmata archaeon]|nr:VCBS repeat-containing protein [Thermoplasmata archaeon]